MEVRAALFDSLTNREAGPHSHAVLVEGNSHRAVPILVGSLRDGRRRKEEGVSESVMGKPAK